MNKKKLTSFVLVFAMVFSLFAGIPLPASAAEVNNTNESVVVCGNHTDKKWIAWGEENALPTTSSSYYYLTEDVTLTGSNLIWEPADGTVLCLNGHVLTVGNITVLENATLTITDCGTTEHKYLSSTTSAWIPAGSSSEGNLTTIKGGIITGSRTGSGSGTYNLITVNGTFNFNGGTICGINGVAINNKGVTTIGANGAVIGNYNGTASYSTADIPTAIPAVVYNGKGATFNNSGKINNNVALVHTVCNDGGIFTNEKTGTINNNNVTTTSDGTAAGGVANYTRNVTNTSNTTNIAKFHNHGQINNNTSARSSGGVLNKGGEFTNYATGQINGNVAARHCGGVDNTSNAYKNSYAGTFFKNYGQVNGNKVTKEHWDNGNYAGGNGAGIYNEAEATIYNYGEICGNTAVGQGGGIYFSDGSGTLIVGGNSNVTGNTDKDKNNSNICVGSGKVIKFDSSEPLTTDACMGVYLYGGSGTGKISYGYNALYSNTEPTKYFFADKPEQRVKLDSGEVYLYTPDIVINVDKAKLPKVYPEIHSNFVDKYMDDILSAFTMKTEGYELVGMNGDVRPSITSEDEPSYFSGTYLTEGKNFGILLIVKKTSGNIVGNETVSGDSDNFRVITTVQYGETKYLKVWYPLGVSQKEIIKDIAIVADATKLPELVVGEKIDTSALSSSFSSPVDALYTISFIDVYEENERYKNTPVVGGKEYTVHFMVYAKNGNQAKLADKNDLVFAPSSKVAYVGSGTDYIEVSYKLSDGTISVTNVSMSESNVTLEVGKTKQLTATLAPTDATDKTVTWYSSNPSVATVDSNGKITAVAAGSATITVTTVDGGLTADCAVTVTAPYYGDIVYIPPSVNVPVSNDDNRVDVSATVSGQDATIKPLNEKQIEQLVGNENASGDVVIDLTGLGKNIDTAGIPKESLEAIVNAAEDAGNATEHLVIKLSTAELKLDDTALRAIVDQADGDIIKFNFDDVGLGRLNKEQKEAVKDMDIRKGYEAYITVNGKRVSDFNGGKVEIIVPYAVPAGENIAGFSVWYIDEQGTPEKQQSTYDGKQKCFVVTHFSDYVIAYSEVDAQANSYRTCPQDHTCPIHGYTDASTTEWYHDGVHYCIENGLMSGYGNGIFKPNTATTRAMLASMLWRLNGSPVVNYQLDFKDVENGQWYTEAIRWAKAEGIAVGYDNGYFGTNDVITREQMVTILWRYAQYKGYDVSVGEDTNILSYDDAFDVVEWAIPAMQWACGSGLVGGMQNSDGNMVLDPQGGTTRAQMATMMMRFCAEIQK